MEEAGIVISRMAEERMAEIAPDFKKCIHDVPGGCHLCNPDKGGAAS